MGASITLAGESLIAQKQAAQQILDVQRFVFANVPGLDPSSPVDRAAARPSADRIVYTGEIPNNNAGFVNPNQVVYSLQVGSDVGDWDFNWIGLESAEGVLFAVAYVPLQQKRRNVPPLQIGNNITRNFLVVYDGAQALTGITIDASTWQHDFTVRLAGIDERERQSNRDIFGRACFFGSALQVEKVGSAYQVKPGTAYVEGIRLQRSSALAIVPPALPTTAWLDVALQRELSDVVASWSVVFGTDLADRTDSAGVRHYLVPIADLATGGAMVDRRPVEAISGPLVQHFAARVGDYEQLRARATTKDDVELGNLPNAKSDDPSLESSETLATSMAVSKVYKQLNIGATAGKYFGVKINNRGQVTEGYGLTPLAEALLEADTQDKAKTLLGIGELPMFTPQWFPSRELLAATPGFFPADGQTIARALVTSATAQLTSAKPLVPIVSEASWQADNTLRGSYTLGDGATTIRLPDYNGRSPGAIAAPFQRGDGTFSAGVAGVIQPDEFRSHVHPMALGPVSDVGSSAQGPDAPSDGTAVMETDAAGGSETRPTNVTGVFGVKLYGAIANQGSIDAAALAAAYASLQGEFQSSFGFQIIYPNGGTAEAPASVSYNSRYVLPNPFAGHHVICVAEIQIGDKWGEAGWFYSSGGYGTKAAQLDLATLVVQTGSSRVGYSSFGSGDPFGQTATALIAAPCRVKVWRVKA
ncbi:phage tail protein [Pseudomonas sp. SWRI51]|uniref:phage tail-collar fiber domain-containing protein n=1 Tax=Pseudomonas sp. SWRI51 TaxID=2745491 RepID=UPI001648DB16|nr:phage tail protein [Pseudomonas sp. SWRI51]